MDKTWVNLPRMTKEYGQAVRNFVHKHAESEGNPEKIICLCRQCRNLIRHSPRDVVTHLVCFGIDPTYDVWIFHGESCHSRNEADEVADKCKAIQAMNTVPHTMSRKGYAKRAKDMTKINDKNSQNSQGMISLNEDGVAKVFGREHRGRIRGLGFGVTPTQLGVRMSSSKKVRELENRITTLQAQIEELYDLVMANFNGKQNVAVEPVTPRGNTPQSHQSSNSVTYDGNIQFQNQLRKCKLLSWQRNVVAEGTIASTDPTVLVHHVPLGADVWKVLVDAAVDPEAILFRPTSDIYTIGQAVGTPIAWHKDFILFD